MKTVKSAVLCLVAIIWSGEGEKDYRFGFTGTGGEAFTEKFRLRYYALEGNYEAGLAPYTSSTYPGHDPVSNKTAIREVAKLNVRMDDLGESEEQFQSRINEYVMDLLTWYLVPIGPKPGIKWYSPNVEELIKAEKPLIEETIQRDQVKDSDWLGSIWEIGNEPNLFPAITPNEYAELFTAYYRVIKKADPSAPVALGALYLPEATQDLRPRLEEYLDFKLSTELQDRNMLDPVQEAGIYTSLLQDLQDELFNRILSQSGSEYLASILDRLPPDVKPDLISLHVYPYDDREPLQTRDERQDQIAAALAGIIDVLDSRNLVIPLFITEFGNTNAELSEIQTKAIVEDMLQVFQSEARVEAWLYYKPTGFDKSLFAILGGTGKAALTRLVWDENFSPADGNFSCDKLNSIGRMYYEKSVGSSCIDKDPSGLVGLKPGAGFRGRIIGSITCENCPAKGMLGHDILGREMSQEYRFNRF